MPDMQQPPQPKPTVRTFDPKDIDDNKILAAIGYLGILCFIPLLLKKDSAFCQYHGKQALVLFIAEIVVSFVNIIPFLGQLIWMVASLAFLAVSIIALIKTIQGEEWEIPYLGQFAEKIKI
jgi:fumarate reductase subunit D